MTAEDRPALVDIHSHLVPGVDDGSRSVEATLDSVSRMRGAGIGRIVTTPHIRGSLTLDPPRLAERLEEVDSAFETAALAVAEQYPDQLFLRGHEVMVDVPEADFSDPRIRMAGTRFVLVEWPRLHVPPGTPRVLRRMRDDGWCPIVAHPERYAGMADNEAVLHQWRDVGAYLQVNYGSFSGRYGSAAQAVAFRILEEGLADYLASDFHGHPTLRIYREEAWALLEERDPEGALETLSRVNPARLLDDLDPLPAACLSPPGLMDRLRGAIRRRDRRTDGTQGR